MVARSLRVSCGKICILGLPLRLDWCWGRTTLLGKLTAARPYLDMFWIFFTCLDVR